MRDKNEIKIKLDTNTAFTSCPIWAWKEGHDEREIQDNCQTKKKKGGKIYILK